MTLANRLIFANRKLFLGAGLLLLIIFGGTVAKVSAADCDNNAIISCGEGTPSSFIAQVKLNDSKNGHHDLQTIYSSFGLVPASYARFATSARLGTAYKDGRIVVDGQTVATGAKSIGRIASYQGAGYFAQNIGGTTYYGNSNQNAFAATSIPVMVMFDGAGQMQFAVLTSCGNPISSAVNVRPSYSCDLIHQSPVAGKPGTFSFTTSASAASNASVVKVVYTFGDGSTATVTNPATPVQHTYGKDGTYTAKVTVYVKLPGDQTITVTSANCATIVTVALPFAQCVQLAAATIGSSKYQYKFIVSGKAGNGATFTSADFKFGDGGTTNGVAISGLTATTTHTYTKDGTYTASAVFHVKSPNGTTTTVTSAGCATKVPVAVPYYSCIQLGGAILDAAKFSYSFTASANFGNGATFTSADFDFGDKNTTNNVKPSGTSVTTTHTYATAGNYTAIATLHFTVGGSIKDVKCQASLTPTQPPTPECTPGVPQGSALCSPCQYNSNVPASDTVHCVAPANLPNTGAGDVIAIFGAFAVGGFLIFRQFIYKRQPLGSDGTMTMEGLFVGPVVSPDTGVVVSHHVKQKHTTRQHPNAVHALHHPTYQQPHRFRPRSHKPDDEA